MIAEALDQRFQARSPDFGQRIQFSFERCQADLPLLMLLLFLALRSLDLALEGGELGIDAPE